jgi:hypothetical protein
MPRNLSPLRWEELRTAANSDAEYHIITEDQLLSIDLGVSSRDVYTAYTVEVSQTGVNDNQDIDVGTNHPLVDVTLMKRFGFREKSVSTQQVQDKPDQAQAEEGGRTSGLKFSLDGFSVDALLERLGLPAVPVPTGLDARLKELLSNATTDASAAVTELLGVIDPALAEVRDKYEQVKQQFERVREDVLAMLGRSAATLSTWKQSRLHNWNRLNVYFESGTVTFLGREAVRIGERVFLPDESGKDGSRGLQGYITSVRHRWGYGDSFETSITVERCITEETRRRVVGTGASARP